MQRFVCENLAFPVGGVLPCYPAVLFLGAALFAFFAVGLTRLTAPHIMYYVLGNNVRGVLVFKTKLAL